MYRDTDEVEKKQPTVKTDPTAPARSAIRRQRTVRYSPNTRLPSVPNTSSTTYRPSSTSVRTRTSSDRRWLLEDGRHRDSARDNLSRQAASETTNLENLHHRNSFARTENVAHHSIGQRDRPVIGRMPIQDVFLSDHTGNRTTLTRGTTVPEAPELPRLRRITPLGGEAGYEYTNVDDYHHDHWPTPPYSSGDSSENSPIRRPTTPLGTASLTPRFAPAHRDYGDVEGESIVAGQSFATRQESLAILTERIPLPEEALNEEDRAFLSTLTLHLEAMRRRSPETLTTPYLTAEAAYLRSVEMRLNSLSVIGMAETASNSADDLPPLLRMAANYGGAARRAAVLQQYRRSEDPQPRHNTLDGLGDRQRSFSPDDENWETMLNTITPDERVPSAHSSFTTAAASGTSRSSASASSSYGTLITIPSPHADIEACPAETSNSGEDDALSIVEEDLSIEGAEDRPRQARGRLGGYQSRLAYLVRNRPRLAHQSRLDDFPQRVAQHGARSEELHGHLQRVGSSLENNSQRMTGHITEDRAFGRQRPEERL